MKIKQIQTAEESRRISSMDSFQKTLVWIIDLSINLKGNVLNTSILPGATYGLETMTFPLKE